MVAGIQNIAQLERIYGRSGSQELLDLFRTKFFFAVGDNYIAEYASRSLGEIEIDETKESLSYFVTYYNTKICVLFRGSSP